MQEKRDVKRKGRFNDFNPKDKKSELETVYLLLKQGQTADTLLLLM